MEGARAARKSANDRCPESVVDAPLSRMTLEERLQADYGGTTVNIGKHPMAHRRESLDLLGVSRAADLARLDQERGFALPDA